MLTCYKHVDNCVQVLGFTRENCGDEEFHKLFLDVENILHTLDETIKIPRIGHLTHRNNIPIKSPEEYLF